jgi:glycosyltransferase involved in cell wall biosynthesis
VTEKKLNVVFVYADSPQEWNCSFWNCLVPAKAINKIEGYNATAIYINEFVSNTEVAQKVCSEADIIVVERNYFGDTLTIMQFWKVRGKTILCIFDDAYDIIHPHNVSFDFWTKGEVKVKDQEGNEGVGYMNPLPIVQFKWGLRIAKGIQVPSVHLASDWSKYNKTHYVHNYLDVDRYANVEPLYPHDEIVIGWCGSLSHHASFTDSGIVYGIKKIGKKYPKVRFLIGGDKRVFDMLEVENKVFQPFVPEDKFTSLIKTLDIGLAPLAGEYDKRRSWIKVLEYMALKIPWVASDYPTYSELKDFGVMTENGGKNWEYAISDAIEKHAEYKERANTINHDFAMTQTSDANIEKTLALYKEIIEEPYE